MVQIHVLNSDAHAIPPKGLKPMKGRRWLTQPDTGRSRGPGGPRLDLQHVVTRSTDVSRQTETSATRVPRDGTACSSLGSGFGCNGFAGRPCRVCCKDDCVTDSAFDAGLRQVILSWLCLAPASDGFQTVSPVACWVHPNVRSR